MEGGIYESLAGTVINTPVPVAVPSQEQVY